MNEDQETIFAEVHTSANPYCDELLCWCHEDADYHSLVTAPFSGEGIGQETIYSFFGLEVGR